MAGPLAGMKVIEMAGIGPGPFCAMMLADMGADVVRIARPDAKLDHRDVLSRNRTVLNLDLRQPEAVQQVLALIAQADVLIEGFRPGVMERLGLGYAAIKAVRPNLPVGVAIALSLTVDSQNTAGTLALRTWSTTSRTNTATAPIASPAAGFAACPVAQVDR